MAASAEIIDLATARERRATAQTGRPVATAPLLAWVPVWFVATYWVSLPFPAAWQAHE